MKQQKPIKVLLAKAGLDGHDRGIRVISQGLNEAGMEVIYKGLRQSPQNVVDTALEEHADVIGLSSLSGAHNVAFVEIIKLLKEKKIKNILLIGGGIIPDEDVKFLKKQGVKEIFGPGTNMDEITNCIRANVAK